MDDEGGGRGQKSQKMADVIFGWPLGVEYDLCAAAQIVIIYAWELLKLCVASPISSPILLLCISYRI